MKKLALLILVATICTGCEPLFSHTTGWRYDGNWFVKNNTKQELYYVSRSSKEFLIPVGDSIFLYTMGRNYELSCDLFYIQLYQVQGEEPSFSITDPGGAVLKCWRMSEQGSEPHHFFDPQSWQQYEGKGPGNVHNWVYTITDEDLKNE